MDVNRFRQLLLSSWNIRGLNDPDKCLDVKMNLSAQPLHVICLQETKLQSIPTQKAASFLPPGFSSFSLLPSIGASGGIATAWDSRFVTHLSDRALQFSLSSTFELVEDGVRFTVTNIYAPCDRACREDFLSEMRSLSDLDPDAWLLVGDFNIARYASDRNNDNFDAGAAESLNDLVDELALQELPLLDRRFTWTNSRADPTLVRLDRAFINLAWGARLFNSTLHSLVRNTSDHVPLLLTASSRAPKSQIFRYEKTWAFSPEYRALVASVWARPQNRSLPCAS
ncbi:uncharacterized protein [Lolium perenne]|uniref:uncharacterized protein n=1 Tax=Lolium perenne TaxID=4522 RepID=UPI003A99DBD0